MFGKAFEKPAMTHHKKQVIELLRSFETGDPKPLSYSTPTDTFSTT